MQFESISISPCDCFVLFLLLLLLLSLYVLLFDVYAFFCCRYDQMLQCWQEDPFRRPTFGAIASWTETLA